MWNRTEISMEGAAGSQDIERRAGLCYDGEYVYRLIVRKLSDGTEKWRHIEVQDGTPTPPTHLFPDAMLGSRLSNIGCSIDQAWEAAPPTIERKRGNTTLLAENVPSQEDVTLGTSYDVEYIVNEEKDLLPTSIRIWESGKDPNGWFQHWIIDAWSKVKDDASGRDRWFPISGTLHQPGRAPKIQISVSSVKINHDLPMSLFRPEDVPPGTALTNATSEGRQGAIAIVGDDRQIDKVVKQVLEDTQHLGATKTGTAKRNWLIAVNLLAITVVIAIFATKAIRKKNRIA